MCILSKPFAKVLPVTFICAIHIIKYASIFIKSSRGEVNAAKRNIRIKGPLIFRI